MNLWIRSQDKNWLMPINDIISVFQKSIFHKGIIIGQYKSEERALEVLDEITNTIKNRYIVKSSGILSQDDIANEHKRLKYFYNGEFVMENPPFEIEPINSNIIYYEMPKE